MARARLVKPAFFTDADLFDAERATGLPLRLAFEGLWCQADKAGRFKWRPRELKLGALPFDDVDFEAVMDALASAGFIQRYEVAGKVYGCVQRWGEHQVLHHTERASTLPAPVSEPHVNGEGTVKAWDSTGTGTGTGVSTGTKSIAAAPRRKKCAPRKAPAQNATPAATLDEAIAELDALDRVPEPEEPKPKHVTWLTPYVGPWEKRFGTGSFPFGKAAKVLSPFKGRPPEEEGARLERFLQETDAKYVSLPRFAETHDSWPPGEEVWNTTDPSKPDYVGLINGRMSPRMELLTRPDGWKTATG